MKWNQAGAVLVRKNDPRPQSVYLRHKLEISSRLIVNTSPYYRNILKSPPKGKGTFRKSWES